jgi:hypothetical protein
MLCPGALRLGIEVSQKPRQFLLIDFPVAFLRRVEASHLAILGSFRASVVTMSPTMILRRVSWPWPGF